MLSLSDNNKFSTSLGKIVGQHQKTDYLNRLTDTERVRQLLSTSRLSDEQLATIWAHVNKTFPGQLTNREVCFALALIAIFQRLEKDGLLAGPDGDRRCMSDHTRDPFALVKLEKKPPVPILYPNNDGANGNQSSSLDSAARLTGSNSVPNDLGALLIDITSEISSQQVKAASHQPARLSSGNSVSLLDDDLQLRVDLPKLKSVWLKCMMAMKALLKRSFDILNVENSRSSALEALKSDQGIAFSKNLCLCYPIAHNIAFKIDELKRFQEEKATGGCEQKLPQIIDKKYATLINDLMISINEYWAVLINLFHESTGLTNFIELIMDGLNQTNKTIACDSFEGLSEELGTMNKADLCSLCHTKFYLVNIGDALDRLDIDKLDLELALSNNLLTNDNQNGDDDQCYFYHVKCANFWLNNVPGNEPGQLPFRSSLARRDDSILKPTTTTPTISQY